MNYVRLKNDYRLRLEVNQALLFNRNVEYILKRPLIISKTEYAIFGFFNGNYTISEIVKLISQYKHININEIDNLINTFITRFNEYIEFIEDKDVRNDIYVYIDKRYLQFPVVSNQLMTPLLVSFVVTDNCFCKCTYCYANGGIGTKDILQTDKIFDLLNECALLGVPAVNISGGDPFTRKDIYKILSKVQELNFDYSVSTKKIITDEDILQIVNHNIKQIQISIDSNQDRICEMLIGTKNYYSRQKEAIKKLKKKDIYVKVNIVVTKLNIKSISSLVEDLLSIGVDKIYLSPYINSLGRYDENLFCDEKDHELLADSLPESSRIDYSRPDYKLTKYNDVSDLPVCTAGRMGLVIFSNGNYGLCERLLNNQIVLGNVEDTSIYDIWKSDKLREVINLSKEKFIGTKCYLCKDFDKCIGTKGICFVRSLIANKRLFGPDSYCPYSDKFIKMY